MSYTPRNPLSGPNILTDKLVSSHGAPLQQQLAPAYKPLPPDYSKNKHDPQPDRNLPNTAYSNATVERRRLEGNGIRVERAATNSTRGESGVKDLIAALSGVESEDYLTPLERKPIHQRNKLR